MNDISIRETGNQCSINVGSCIGGKFVGINRSISIPNFLTRDDKSPIFCFLSFGHPVPYTPSSSNFTANSISILNTIWMEIYTDASIRHQTLCASSTHIVSIIVQTFSIYFVTFSLVQQISLCGALLAI